MALPIVAGIAARAIAKKIAKELAKKKAKKGVTGSIPKGASKATSKVSKERAKAVAKNNNALDSAGQTAAKIKRTKSQLAKDGAARRKAGDPSAPRT